jgi:hypothetical protein
MVRRQDGMRALGSAEINWFEPIVGMNAWEAYIDECPTVPADELHEAYGIDDRAEFDRMVADARDGLREWPELSDEHTHQSNSTDTGIVYSADRTLDRVGSEGNLVRFKVCIN